MEAMGIIFSNVYDSYMGDLTDVRTSAAIPFGGRYRQVDFALSNMSGAGMRHIGIITKYNYESLMNHLGSCQEWDLTLEDRGLVLLPPYATGHTGVYRGKLEALYTALDVLEHAEQDYVLLTDTTVLAAVDYLDALNAHVESGCDITVLTKRLQGSGQRKYALAVHKDENNRPTDMVVDCAIEDVGEVSMGMFIISRRLLIDAIKHTVPHGKYHLERDFILSGFNAGTLSVNVWSFPHTALFNESLPEYYANSMALLDPAVRSDLFHSSIPIYTKTRNEVPTFYGKKAQVTECITADGCTLAGSCRRSVFFREVTVDEGAEVQDCVIMQGSRVGTGASLQYVILDKDVTVRPYTRLTGSPEHPLYIKKGATV